MADAALRHPSLEAPVRFDGELLEAMVARTDPATTWACAAGEIHARADDLLTALDVAHARSRSFRSLVSRTLLRRALARLGREPVCVSACAEALEAARRRRERYDAGRAA